MSCKAAYDTRYAYSADASGTEGTLDNNFRLRKRRACATYGNRAAKWTATKSSETLYFNTMWTWHTDTGLPDGQYSKHIYLGETRVGTKQTSKLEASYGQSDEWHHQYYYHPDHLGSAQLITDYEGNEYQRIEYTPYGELWVEKKTEKEEGLRYLPYKFTAKEQDEETGLYYYGARYLDAKYSRWMSADPAVGEYIPIAPVNDEAKKHNGQLPGQGGVFNVVNFQLYHYAGNNPVKYTDPTGKSTAAMFIIDFSSEVLTAAAIAGIITPELASTVVGAIVLFALLLEDSDRIENALDKMDEANTSAQQADSVKENIQDNVQSASPSPMPPDDGENEKQSDKQSTSSNQMNQQVKRGQAPKSVDRVDTANTNVKGEQDHIHFKDGNALNKDGSWKEGSGRPLTNAERKWITDNNWTLPTD